MILGNNDVGDMRSELDLDREVTLHLTETCARPVMASIILAQKLGISVGEATDRLRSVSGPVSAPLARQKADRLRAVLSTLGVRLEIHPADHDATVDLFLQTTVWADLDKVATRVARLIGGTVSDTMSQLAKPAGLLISGLSSAAVSRIELQLRRIKGLQINRVDRCLATFDLFATRKLVAQETARLAEVRAKFGLAGDPISGAALAGLSHGLCARIVAALPPLDLVAVPRSVQRFDLYLAGYSGWLTKDLADFLAARTGQPRARFELISAMDPVRLDVALTYAAASRFCADYAAIGLYVRPSLRGLHKDPENPIL
jgi:hypothetical protein